jgi:selenocysteine lyase/cysteine desulfurase
VNPVEAVGAAIAGTEAVFLVDATQSLGQLPVDVDAMGCHALTASGRKWLRGPRGTGFLYVRNDVSDRIDPVTVGLVTSDVSFDNYSIREEVAMRSNARRFEAWERNVAAEIGLAVAIEYFLEVGIDWAHHRIVALASYVLDRLRSVPGVFVLPTNDVRSGVVGLTVPGGEPAVVALRGYLRERSVHVSSMAYIDAPLDYAARGIDAVLRISPHYYNTDNEVDTLCEHLADGLKALAA